MSANYVGPKTTELHQLKEVMALPKHVFRSDCEGDLGLLFHPDRLGQLRIFESDGKPVSLVGMILNDTVLLGCSVRVACIGSVCTDEPHRGRGLAGRLVEDAVERKNALHPARGRPLRPFLPLQGLP